MKKTTKTTNKTAKTVKVSAPKTTANLKVAKKAEPKVTAGKVEEKKDVLFYETPGYVKGELPKATEAPKTADVGPNENYPFGVKITNEKGGFEYERFHTAKVRDTRMKVLAKTEKKVEAVEYQKPEAELGNAKGVKGRSSPTLVPTIPVGGGSPGTEAGTKAAKKTAPRKKADKPKADPVVKLLAKGVFYFPQATMEKLAGTQYLLLEAKGKKVTLTPTNSAKDSLEVRHNQIGVSKVLKEIGWNKATQELPIKMSGDSIVVEVR